MVVATKPFASLPRPIIDGRPAGFCKIIADRRGHTILGDHIVGGRDGGRHDGSATRFGSVVVPTYSNALSRSAVTAARELTLAGSPESDDDIDPDATTIDPMALSPG